MTDWDTLFSNLARGGHFGGHGPEDEDAFYRVFAGKRGPALHPGRFFRYGARANDLLRRAGLVLRPALR